jgi:hypothetical protein
MGKKNKHKFSGTVNLSVERSDAQQQLSSTTDILEDEKDHIKLLNKKIKLLNKKEKSSENLDKALSLQKQLLFALLGYDDAPDVAIDNCRLKLSSLEERIRKKIFITSDKPDENVDSLIKELEKVSLAAAETGALEQTIRSYGIELEEWKEEWKDKCEAPKATPEEERQRRFLIFSNADRNTEQNEHLLDSAGFKKRPK